MNTPGPQEILTSNQKNLCSYTGYFGALIALTCLIQHMAIIARSHWIVFILMGIYLFIMTAFIMLALQKMLSPVLLIIAAALSLIAEVILAISGVFSLIVLILFIYTVVIVVVIYVEQIPRLLKQKALALKIEEDLWKDKI